MLKKKENSLYSVRGRKLQAVYLALDTAFGGNLGGGYCPMLILRDVPPGGVALVSSVEVASRPG